MQIREGKRLTLGSLSTLGTLNEAKVDILEDTRRGRRDRDDCERRGESVCVALRALELRKANARV